MFRRCARLPIALAALLFALSPSTLKAEGRPTPVSGRASLEDAPAASLSAPALVARGTERFRRGNYDGAIADFYAAYERQQVPTLLFNIAQAHRKSGRGKDALTVFEQFKLADPKSSLLPEVDAYIAELKAKQEAERAIAERDRTELLARVAEQRAKEAAALAKALEEERLRSELQGRPLAPPPPPPVYKRGWFWGLTAGGVGAVILAATLVGVFARPPPEPATDLAPRRVLF